MPIQWLPHALQNEWIEILQFKPGDQWYVRISPFADFWRTTPLHWSVESSKNVPCLGKRDCYLCPRPTKIITYVPCSALRINGGTAWVKRILPVNESFRWVLERDLEKTVWAMGRKIRKNEPIRVTIADLGKVFPVVPGFHLEASLRKCWGSQATVDSAAAAP